MLKYFSIAVLLVAFIASILVFTGSLSEAVYKTIFNVVTVLWFITAPVWMVPELFGRRNSQG